MLPLQDEILNLVISPKALPLQGYTLGYNISDFQSLNQLLDRYAPHLGVLWDVGKIYH